VLTDAFEPRLEADAKGGATVRLYGDLKRHAMGGCWPILPGRATPSRRTSRR
jgi:hypothetical protein